MLHTYLYCENFIIKLGSYSNKENLTHKVTLLDSASKKDMILIKEDELYKLFSHNFKTKDEALHKLSKYKKIFTDAYIMVNPYNHEQNNSINLTSALASSPTNTKDDTSIPPSHNILSPIKETVLPMSMYDLINNQTFYLCPEKITTSSEKILIEADFLDNNVSYTTIIGKVPNLKMRYIIKNNRLYILHNNKVSISQYSTIDKIFFEYMVLSRWMKGKKIHQMRYYKKEEDAKSYISSIDIL